MEPEVDLIRVGVSPDGVPWPDPQGPKPDTVKDLHWQIITLRSAGHTIQEVADQLGLNKRSVEGHIRRLRERWGPEFLRSPGSHAARTPTVTDIVKRSAAGAASQQKWAEIRATLAMPVGVASAKAIALAEMVLDRYLADTPEGEDLRSTLTISDAKQLAALAVALGERADELSTPLQGPGAFTPGNPALFGKIDGAAAASASDETVQQLELIVARFHQTAGTVAAKADMPEGLIETTAS